MSSAVRRGSLSRLTRSVRLRIFFTMRKDYLDKTPRKALFGAMTDTLARTLNRPLDRHPYSDTLNRIAFAGRDGRC